MTTTVSYPSLPHWDQYGDIWVKEPLGKIQQTSDLNTRATQTSVVEISGSCSPSEGIHKTPNGEPPVQFFPSHTTIATPDPQTSSGSRELLSSTPHPHIQNPDDIRVNNGSRSLHALDEQISRDSSYLEVELGDHSNVSDTLSKFEALSRRPGTANSDISSRNLLTPTQPSKRIRSHSNPIELNSSGEKKAQFYSDLGTDCSMPLDSVDLQLRVPFPSQPTTSPTSFSSSLTVQTSGTTSVHGADKIGLSKPTISLMEPLISKINVDQPKPRAQKPDPYEPKENTHIEPILNERPNSKQRKTTIRNHSPALDASIREILLKNVSLEGRVYILKAPGDHRKMFPNIPSLVKVGMTKDLKTRMYDLKNKCGLEDLVQVEDREDRPCKAYWKIEQLVHAELKQFQFKYDCQCKNQKGLGTEHQEWFAVDESVALRAVQRWRNFMSRDPYDGNGVLRDRWSDMLMGDTMPKFGAEDLRSDSIGWDEGWKEWLKKGDAKRWYPEA